VASDQRHPNDDGWDMLQHPGGAVFDWMHDLSCKTNGMGHRAMMKPNSTTHDLAYSIEISTLM
jgi:hypothetical protein